MNKKIKFIIFGGNRLKEDGPVTFLIDYLLEKKINFKLVTDPEHLKKECKNKKLFEEKIKKINYLKYNKLADKQIAKLIDSNTYGLSINSIWKFSKNIINEFNGKLFNYHPANLPEERGAGNLSWKILQNNFKKNTINIHKVEEDLDTGKIVFSKKIKFKKKLCLPNEYYKIISKNEKFFLKEFVDKIIDGKTMKEKKQKGEKFYWPRLNSDIDGKINWNWKAKDIVLFIKAFSHPFNGAFTFIKKNKIRIFDASIIRNKKFHPFQNGIIYRENNSEIYISNSTGSILIKKINLKSNHSQKKYLGKRFL